MSLNVLLRLWPILLRDLDFFLPLFLLILFLLLLLRTLSSIIKLIFYVVSLRYHKANVVDRSLELYDVCERLEVLFCFL